MLFKKLTALPLDDTFEVSLGDLEAAVIQEPARECQYSETEHLGFDYVFEGSRLRVWPLENERVLYLRLTEHKRVLPASVVSDEVDKRCKEIEKKTGEKVKGKARREVKDEVKIELLKKAFQKTKSIQVILNLADRELWIDEASDGACQKVRKLFQKVIGNIPTSPLPSSDILSHQMKDWLLDENFVPAAVQVLDQAKLVDTSDRKATVTAKGEELHSKDFQALLDHRDVVELRIAIEGAVSCQLTPAQIFKGIKSETPAENQEQDDAGGMDQWFDSEIYLTVAELREARRVIGGLAIGEPQDDVEATKEAS